MANVSTLLLLVENQKFSRSESRVLTSLYSLRQRNKMSNTAMHGRASLSGNVREPSSLLLTVEHVWLNSGRKSKQEKSMEWMPTPTALYQQQCLTRLLSELAEQFPPLVAQQVCTVSISLCVCVCVLGGWVSTLMIMCRTMLTDACVSIRTQSHARTHTHARTHAHTRWPNKETCLSPHFVFHPLPPGWLMPGSVFTSCKLFTFLWSTKDVGDRLST